MANFGISTGMNAAPEISDLFLNMLDLHIMHTMNERNTVIIKYCRYLDDGFMAVDSSFDESSSITDVVNGWNKHIQIDPIHLSQSVNYLDLHCEVVPRDDDGCDITYRTFRKEANLFSYLPRSSAHHRSVFDSIVSGENMRLLRTNKFSRDFYAQQRLFISKLSCRGYDAARAIDICRRFPFWNKSSILRSSAPRRKRDG